MDETKATELVPVSATEAKLPLPRFIEKLYLKQFKRERPKGFV